jgi:hypothetical protein
VQMATRPKTIRKRISKTTRFEVFKRDLFTCQYCGRKAPDVILQADHLVAVANGGGNDLLNLITSCIDCNQGKGCRPLDDKSLVVRQRKALEEEGARVEQAVMLAEWSRSLAKADETIAEQLASYINDRFQCSINANGMQRIRKWLARYPVPLLLECAEICHKQYVTFGPDGKPDWESVCKALDYIPRVAAVKSDPDPNRAKIAYIAGILKNRLHYFGARQYRELVEAFIDAEGCLDDLQEWAKECRNWTGFKQMVNGYVQGAGNG